MITNSNDYFFEVIDNSTGNSALGNSSDGGALIFENAVGFRSLTVNVTDDHCTTTKTINLYIKECKQFDNLSQDFYSNDTIHFEAIDYISSSSEINQYSNIIFDAGNEIDLQIGFQVNTGGIFHAFIDGCPD